MLNKADYVDDLITAVPGGWKFDKATTKSFDSHVRKSVPLYDELQRLVIEMSEWFIRDGGCVYDLGCSTGETISALIRKHSNKKDLKLIGIDSSVPMIKTAKQKCHSATAQFIQRDIAELAEFPNADLVISLYTLQFLPLNIRKKVIQRIYDSLSEGGALMIAEKISGESAFFEDIWLELHWDFKRDHKLTDDQIISKARSLRGVLVPLTLSENIFLLKEAGFKNIDVFAKWCNFAGIIAVKSGVTNAAKQDNFLAGKVYSTKDNNRKTTK